MKIRWTEKATANFFSIHAFISEQSDSYADSVFARLLDRPQQLIDHPFSGSIVPEFNQHEIRELFSTLFSNHLFGHC